MIQILFVLFKKHLKFFWSDVSASICHEGQWTIVADECILKEYIWISTQLLE